jgi:Tfp pilus assembly protein PilV
METLMKYRRSCPKMGLSIIETMIAMVVLVGAFMLVFTLFHASLRYTNRVEKRVFASIIAEKKLEEIRSWASKKAAVGYNYDSDWSTYSGACGPDPGNPEYIVSVTARNSSIDSPSRSFEALLALPEKKRLHSAVKKVRVSVAWDPHDPAKSLSFTTLVKEPVRSFRNPRFTIDNSRSPATDPIVVSAASIPDPLPRDGTVSFTALAYDSENNVICDLFFLWYVQPITDPATGVAGNATITQAHNGSSATLVNKVILPGGAVGYTGGKCLVKARAVYGGIEQWGSSEVINLAP